MTDIAAGSIRPPAPIFTLDRGPVAAAAGGLVLGAIVIAQLVDVRQAALFLIGGALGLTLSHASFGFTGGWRRLVAERRGAAMRAQMLMIAVAALFFIPLLTLGNPFGRPLAGAIAPVGVSVLFGAAIFGLGM